MLLPRNRDWEAHGKHVDGADIDGESRRRPMPEPGNEQSEQVEHRSADEHLVHRRVELHPGKALRKSSRILGKELRKIRVLEVPDPVWHAEVAEIDDWG